jgi:hypothetical protein
MWEDMWNTVTGWFGSGDSSSSTPTGDASLVWNPDKGWVNQSTGNVVYSGSNASSTNYDTGIVNQLAMTPGMEAASDAFGSSFDTAGWLGGLVNKLGLSTVNNLMKQSSSNGKVNPSTLASLAGGILGGINPSWMQPNIQKTGYQGGIPSYTAVREAVPGTYDPNRRPGSRGQEYFTDVQFSSPTDVATAKSSAAQQATEAEARNKAREAEIQTAKQNTAEYAAGGLASMAKGRYLAGPTDGMEDRLDATIENKQPAKLSHGEFVIPADVVGHLGNGNSEAGAQRLYDMMDKVRKARTGTTKQGKQINPNKYLPG